MKIFALILTLAIGISSGCDFYSHEWIVASGELVVVLCLITLLVLDGIA